MSLEPQTREIDGVTYTFAPFGAKEGRKLFLQLVQRFGGALSGGQIGGDDEVGGLKMVGALCAKLEPEFYERVAGQLFTRVLLPHGDKDAVRLSDVAELHLGGNILREIKIVQFCLEAQFSDFLAFARDAMSSRGPGPQLAATGLASSSRKG